MALGILPAAPAMTTTMTFTSTSTTAAPCCPNCGVSFLEDPQQDPTAALLQAQKTIAELQGQVRLLNQKAAAAVDRWADYEDELAQLRAASANNSNGNNAYSHNSWISNRSNGSNNGRTSFLNAGASRISAMLSPRKSSSQLRTPAPPTPPSSNDVPSPHLSGSPPPSMRLPSIQSRMGGQSTESGEGGGAEGLGVQQPNQLQAENGSTNINNNNNNHHLSTNDELLSALSREQSLRRTAESRLDATSREVEELSVTLFEQANEMVASERRARARLEERVTELERRDVEKRDRLGRLENAMTRIDRVDRLLGNKA